MAYPSDLIVAGRFNDIVGGTFVLDHVRDGGTPTIATVGTPTIDATAIRGPGSLKLENSGSAEYVDYTGANIVDGMISQGCIEFFLQPLYSGSPGTANRILAICKAHNDPISLIYLYHHTTGVFYAGFHDDAGVSSHSVSFAWSPTSGNWYHISLNWNFDPSIKKTWLFFNGIRESYNFGNYPTRDGSCQLMRLGGWHTGLSAPNHRLDALLMHDEVQRTEDFQIPIENPSFEEAYPRHSGGAFEVIAIPDYWSLTGGVTQWERATFDGLHHNVESFEAGWSDNEDRRTEFGATDLDDASFDTATPEAVEDFEEEWDSNEDRRTEFGATDLDDALFDSEASGKDPFEDFEEEWSDNEDRRTEFGVGELDDASFDTGTPEAFEDFEEEWSDNEDRRTEFGGGELDDATFQEGTGTQTYESFDDTQKLDVPDSVGYSVPTLTVDPTMRNRIDFGGTLTGQITLQVRRENVAAWEDRDEITTVPTTVELESGLEEVRVHRDTTGGTTTGALGWVILTEV